MLNERQVLQREGVLAYTSIEEGEITATRLAQLPDDVEADRVQFLQVRLHLLYIITWAYDHTSQSHKLDSQTNLS